MPKRPTTNPQTIRLYRDQDERLQALAGNTQLDKSELIRMALDALLEANGVGDEYVARWKATKPRRAVVLPVRPLGSRAHHDAERWPLAA